MPKTNRTSDGKHVQFGEKDTFESIPGSNAPDAAFCPQWFGRMMNDDEPPTIEQDSY